MLYKTKQFLFFLIKLAIVIGAFYFIYDKIVHNEQVHLHEFIKQLEARVFNNSESMFLLLGYSVLNWTFEILKWKNLVSSIKTISFIEGLKQSLGSLTGSLFTPNRIGEYGAKAIYYQKAVRRKVLLLNLVSNITQMTVTLIFGLIGLAIFTRNFEIEIDLFRLRRGGYIIALILVFGLTGSLIGTKKIRGFYIQKIIDFIKDLGVRIHLKNGLYAVIRYLIFSHQFYFLLQIFGVDSDYVTLMAMISTMYLLASIVPNLALFDWLIKGSVALWIFHYSGINELDIITITLIMWGLNFGLPAIIGSFFVLNFRISTK